MPSSRSAGIDLSAFKNAATTTNPRMAWPDPLDNTTPLLIGQLRAKLSSRQAGRQQVDPSSDCSDKFLVEETQSQEEEEEGEEEEESSG